MKISKNYNKKVLTDLKQNSNYWVGNSETGVFCLVCIQLRLREIHCNMPSIFLFIKLKGILLIHILNFFAFVSYFYFIFILNQMKKKKENGIYIYSPCTSLNVNYTAAHTLRNINQAEMHGPINKSLILFPKISFWQVEYHQ